MSSNAQVFLLLAIFATFAYSQFPGCSGCAKSACPEATLCIPTNPTTKSCRTYYNHLTVGVELNNFIDGPQYYGYCIRLDDFAQLSIYNGTLLVFLNTTLKLF